jgi:hypothetical protein
VKSTTSDKLLTWSGVRPQIQFPIDPASSNISDILLNSDRLERGAIGDQDRAILYDEPTGALPAF